jgi:branched-subunit amino acid aminotransferase/4-amino-4-deoxychorismate lyase
LTEGARSTLFAVRGGSLLTPPAAEVLPGITRDLVVHVMRDTDHPVAESPLAPDVGLYDEVFITATSMHVMPVTSIDGRAVGNGRVGPITREAMARFENYCRKIRGPG